MAQMLATFRGTENILYNHAKLKKGENCYDSRHYSIDVSGNRVYQMEGAEFGDASLK